MKEPQIGEREIEVPYEVIALPDLSAVTLVEHILQEYVSTEKPPLRIRRTDVIGRPSAFEMTKKVKGDVAGEDTELTIPLSLKEYTVLRSLQRPFLTKARLHLSAPGAKVVHLNVYTGELAPLVIAEVEFVSIAQRDAFTPPTYLGASLAGIVWTKNSFLAGKRFSEIAPMLNADDLEQMRSLHPILGGFVATR